MRKIIVGNWKMHGTAASARALAQAVVTHGAGRAEVIVCPPAVFLGEVSKIVAGTPIGLGAQDCHWEREGAFTGEVSAAMLKEAGCSHVIVGHSEWRMFHVKHCDSVTDKASRAIAEGLVPIICIGESAEERNAGRAEAAVTAQLQGSLPKNAANGTFILAYEPVWAIGTGRTPSMADITAMHRHLAGVAPGAKILYGGSVRAANAGEILGAPEVAGVLVGGASLDAGEFGKIIDAA